MTGVVGALDCWASYREFWFDGDGTALHNGDAEKVAEIASYMQANPSLEVGLDRFAGSSSSDRRRQDFNDRRANAVRAALVQEGVEARRISIGEFEARNLSRDGRVAVLLRTDANSPPPVVPLNGTASSDRWTPNQEFWFDQNRAELHAADASKIAELARLVRQDPSLGIGIDSATNRVTSSSADADMAARRGDAVRNALTAAGVPAANITRGELADPGRQRDRCVMVLIRSTQVAMAP